VVAIGGGLVGVPTLYHLARKDWTDSGLVERKELTSGSVRSKAAGSGPINDTDTIIRIRICEMRKTCYHRRKYRKRGAWRQGEGEKNSCLESL
jgi:glycine/D-amino acid oxidase-like deaminating enzyme